MTEKGDKQMLKCSPQKAASIRILLKLPKTYNKLRNISTKFTKLQVGAAKSVMFMLTVAPLP